MHIQRTTIISDDKYPYTVHLGENTQKIRTVFFSDNYRTYRCKQMSYSEGKNKTQVQEKLSLEQTKGGFQKVNLLYAFVMRAALHPIVEKERKIFSSFKKHFYSL